MALDGIFSFPDRHIGPSENETTEMLSLLKKSNMDELIEEAFPSNILSHRNLDIGKDLSEEDFLTKAREISKKNKVFKSYIGQGYYGCNTPTVILRNILESPAWYTAYTPYQAEISQGRMEALINFQTMVMDLTGMEIANASLLDEGTAIAEAVNMTLSLQRKFKKTKVFASANLFAQSKSVLQTRMDAMNIQLDFGDESQITDFSDYAAVVVQYPNAIGEVCDYSNLCKKAHAENALVVAAADILSLSLLTPPAEWGADIAVGSTQRFGVPMGFGGPHAAYIATKEQYKRNIPGRIIGLSKDQQNNPAYRLALQTREQHIRREKATSNICTAQVLLAVMASMYAVYHGPKGIKGIASRVLKLTTQLKAALESLGYKTKNSHFFDTLCLDISKADAEKLILDARKQEINLGLSEDNEILISVDETTSEEDLDKLLTVFSNKKISVFDFNEKTKIPSFADRKTPYLQHATFNSYHSETEMLRYIYKLQSKDLTLANSMIPLGSCTMKLNASSEMTPVTWPEFNLHPFVPEDQSQGYAQIIHQLEHWLCDITGFSGVSLQPNAGSQGEYAGLLVIKKFHEENNQSQRNICLIPSSAHGTNPASATMASMKVVVTKCDSEGNIDIEDLKAKAEQYKNELAALMVTYPSTHGVFEETITDICDIIHNNGGQVYMDGANLNALVGLSEAGKIGPDVCHLNLHKTFCIPHGGGGPGIGPIAVGPHLVDYLPSHPLAKERCGGQKGISPVSAAPWGSASILPISWAYIAMMGSEGLKKATQVAILNANYMAKRLEPHFSILYRGKNDCVAHECIVDVRPFKDSANITVDDFAKRLMDFGFHAPTMSWPVAGTLMIEPTESESKEEIDRFCDAMIAIKQEITDILDEKLDKEDNPLKNAPHSISYLTKDEWPHSYSREQAAYPLPWVREHKFWVPVGRVDNAYGDRNLVCSCPSLEEYASES